MMVSEYYNALNPCVDIETSTSDFYIKVVDNIALREKQDKSKSKSFKPENDKGAD